MTVNTFWRTASISSEYHDSHKARFLCILVVMQRSSVFSETVGKIWETKFFERENFRPSKRLKITLGMQTLSISSYTFCYQGFLTSLKIRDCWSRLSLVIIVIQIQVVQPKYFNFLLGKKIELSPVVLIFGSRSMVGLPVAQEACAVTYEIPFTSLCVTQCTSFFCICVPHCPSRYEQKMKGVYSLWLSYIV